VRKIGLCFMAVLLTACSSPEPEAVSTQPGPEEELNRYADNLVAGSGGDLRDPEHALETGYRPLSFVLKFRTDNPALLAKDNADSNKAAYESNLRNTEAWQARFCAGVLKAIMRHHDIFLVSGHLLDDRGNTQAIAPCTL